MVYDVAVSDGLATSAPGPVTVTITITGAEDPLTVNPVTAAAFDTASLDQGQIIAGGQRHCRRALDVSRSHRPAAHHHRRERLCGECRRVPRDHVRQPPGPGERQYELCCKFGPRSVAGRRQRHREFHVHRDRCARPRRDDDAAVSTSRGPTTPRPSRLPTRPATLRRTSPPASPSMAGSRAATSRGGSGDRMSTCSSSAWAASSATIRRISGRADRRARRYAHAERRDHAGRDVHDQLLGQWRHRVHRQFGHVQVGRRHARHGRRQLQRGVHHLHIRGRRQRRQFVHHVGIRVYDRRLGPLRRSGHRLACVPHRHRERHRDDRLHRHRHP